MLNRASPAAALAAVVLWPEVSVAQPPPRALSDAVRAITSLRDFTAFDWVGAHTSKGR